MHVNPSLDVDVVALQQCGRRTRLSLARRSLRRRRDPFRLARPARCRLDQYAAKLSRMEHDRKSTRRRREA
jgi:hypothetical protein